MTKYTSVAQNEPLHMVSRTLLGHIGKPSAKEQATKSYISIEILIFSNKLMTLGMQICLFVRTSYTTPV